MARHSGRVRGFLARRLSRREDVEEATQDVFVKVHRGAGTYDPERDFSPWLFAIARNVVRDHLRRARPAPLPLPADPTAGLFVYESAPRAVEVRDAIRRLPDRYRRAVTLKYLAGLSYREAARELSLSEKGFETRLTRARILLRKLLLGEHS
jgi:RNA polymerase sigma-70 factor (ECF subfamily)